MTIIVNKNYGVTLPEGDLLGSVGEHLLRTVRVIHPTFQGAGYSMIFRYPDGTVYECLVENGEMPVHGSLLTGPCTVEAQFCATVQGENDEADLVFESEVFQLTVGDGLAEQAQPADPEEDPSGYLAQRVNVRKMSLTDYNAMESHNSGTLYVVTYEGSVSLYLGNIVISSGAALPYVICTQAEYDAITSPDEGTLYVIREVTSS